MLKDCIENFYNIVVINQKNRHMHSLHHTVEEVKLFEAIADIAFIAGQKGFCSGDSREDIAEIIRWGKEFEAIHEETDWDDTDYTTAIEAFAANKMRVGM